MEGGSVLFLHTSCLNLSQIIPNKKMSDSISDTVRVVVLAVDSSGEVDSKF